MGEPAAGVLYRNIWSDTSCLAAAWQIFGLAALIVTATLALILGIVALSLRRRPDKDREWRIARLIVLAALPLALGIGAWVAFLDTSLRRATFVAEGLHAELCDGPRERSVLVPRAGIAGVQFRWRWSGGKSPSPIDEFVFRDRSGAPVVVPLSYAADGTDPAVLKRHIPPDVIVDWATAVRQRGHQLPASYLVP